MPLETGKGSDSSHGRLREHENVRFGAKLQQLREELEELEEERTIVGPDRTHLPGSTVKV